MVVQAQEIRGQPDLQTVAEGEAELQRGPVTITADRLSYDQPEDLAVARGQVRISRDGNTYTGPELQLKVQSFEGFFLEPTYFFARTGAGGRAERVDFLDEQRAVAHRATYSSCRPEDPLDAEGRPAVPAWELSTRQVRLDFDANEGIAEGAVLRFYGVPILAAPVLSFPLTEARKSGWLPPSITLDNKSGLQVSAPYYWNIAPNRDATLTPTLSAKRGAGLETEYRYLEPRYHGSAVLDFLPHDRLAGRSRYALGLQHDAALPRDTRVALKVLRVSDDDYWKDFTRNVPSLTPRLLASDLQLSRPVGDWQTYARVQSWQVLQTADPTTRIEAPYDRAPQLGARTTRRLGGGLELDVTGEFNRFTNPGGVTGGPTGVPTGAIAGGSGVRLTGSRLHALASIARPWTSPGWTLTPRLALNAATYSTDQAMSDGRRSASRVIPTVSVDSAWVLERETSWFGRGLRQTLEPRLLYVRTPFRDQSALPNFDAAAKDFNIDSIYTENAFSGVDRVSDSHQLTAGVTTRVLDDGTGVEAMRLGLVQRFLFRDQRVTPDGPPSTRRFSDILLFGSTGLLPSWTLESSVQYSPDIRRVVRSLASARFSPGPFRTLNLSYRLTRGLSEQVELGWQWPLYGPVGERVAGQASRADGSAGGGLFGSGGADCRGTWYGVGRVNYSTRDSRVTDSVIGMEYDAGCWIGRVVAERLSTGRSEATTRLLLQLELVGLSRLGSSPLQVLKDNIPGYRLLRDPAGSSLTPNAYD
ncbi:LPS assembly protein LptD [Piscinibacter sakaiensis]|uniref:LPS-assembly protein LptD n=1 Tax=Piscinibacter sakaiensis TaxID=1547922 RepID=UPI00372CD213